MVFKMENNNCYLQMAAVTALRFLIISCDVKLSLSSEQQLYDIENNSIIKYYSIKNEMETYLQQI